VRCSSRIGVVALLVFVPVGSRAEDITAEGQKLSKFLDGLDVEKYWLSGRYVKWDTGEPLDKPVTDGGKHTHCSAFAAATAKRLGIYLLRPPDHSATQLANAQYDWLSKEGKKQEWKPVASAREAQGLANRGYLVVAVCKEKDRAGHAALVRPSSKSVEDIDKEGPQIIQAGATNYSSTSLVRGFKSHSAAVRETRIRYYAHEIGWK